MNPRADVPADLGLLLDVDGPLASPITRTIAIDQIGADLVDLAGRGVPIAFITGRSDAFIRETVMPALEAHGLEEALAAPGTRMFGVFEKGAAWAPIGPGGIGEVEVDASVLPPAEYHAACRALVEEDFSDLVFFDETKRAMISVEQHPHVPAEEFAARRGAVDDALFAEAARLGVGVAHGDRRSTSEQDPPFRLDPTIISTDIESVVLDKDRGARRAIAHFRERGPLPRRWRSVGDSRSDYKMADELYAAGFDVAHVDVRPSDGVLDKPYPVVIEGDLIHDEAGAAFLAHWVRELSADGRDRS